MISKILSRIYSIHVHYTIRHDTLILVFFTRTINIVILIYNYICVGLLMKIPKAISSSISP